MAPFRVKALYEYASPHEDDLKFDIGQIITVNEQEDDDWYGGEYIDADGVKQEGIFPRNFVEKIEPQAPPRPVRNRPKKETEAPVLSPAAAPTLLPEQSPEETLSSPPPPPPVAPVEPEPEPELHHEPEPVAPVREPEPEPAPASVPGPSKPLEKSKPAPSTSRQSAAPPVSKPKQASPPPVSEKPSGNAFKDRIAAFNKSAAPPVAPFKPSGFGSGSAGGTGFIKKPFVAPPPSRNAFVPPPQAAPVSKVYRRDEDPEIRDREAENQEQAEKAGLVAHDDQAAGDEGDQPKPTTLKERIALLQQQQKEQAQRHAESAAKKEKPKKPAKKAAEAPPVPAQPEEIAGEEEEEEADIVPTPVPAPAAAAPPPLPRRSTEDSGARTSVDEPRALPPPRRKSSKGPAVDPVRDGNEADMSGAGDTTEGHDDTTEREDNEEKSRHSSRASTGPMAIPGLARREDLPHRPHEQQAQDDDEEDVEGEEDDEDVDPEAKRKEELRARMAKMSGGMGFHGMFGVAPPPAAPPKKKKSKPEPESIEEDTEEPPTSPRAAPPVPTMMALPGMGPRRSQDSTRDEEDEPEPTPRGQFPPSLPRRDDTEEDDDETTPALTPAPSASQRDPPGAPPPVPGGRPVPPPVPTESRAPPPLPPTQLQSPTEGSASDDEGSSIARDNVPDSARPELPGSPRLPPPPPQPLASPGISTRPPPFSPSQDQFSPISPNTTGNKRNSRPPPPIPGTAPAPPSQSRPPPPPPPAGPLSRHSTAEAHAAIPTRPTQAGDENEEEGTEYEGDYDTDIASSAPHKDALKAHARESSLEDNSLQSPIRDVPPQLPPPIPSAAAPRAVPPPPPVPTQVPQPPAESKRRSVDVPRAAPPRPPPTKESTAPQPPPIPTPREEYDPYSHSITSPGYSHKTPKIEEESYFRDVPTASPVQSPPDRRAPPPAPSGRSGGPRQSLDVGRKSMSTRRSVDVQRPVVDSGFIANDIDLALQSGWFKQSNQVPPLLQGRKDILFESEESTTTNQGSKTVITRDIFVLFQDYSQTILAVRYDPYNLSDVEIEQRHEPPPRALRQDQMEEVYERFGRPIADAVASKKDSVVGDGTPHGLIHELLRPHSDALRPVGTRAYGAIVYSNMANASTQLHDVIRPGDILSIRNAKFQGKHGPMHAKYSVEVGKPDHVAVVAEWDGTKKKIRAWEQGRESRKVKMESFKLDDLRSGEVKIWRVMPRGWVGWNSQP